MLPIRVVEYAVSVAVLVGPVLLTLIFLDRMFKE
jgi:hypothetical protein